MKLVLACICFLFCLHSFGQSTTKKNIFIITLDGFRWQEVFSGADSILMNNVAFVKDTALINEMYWDNLKEVRRKKLMPFLWNVIAKQGQLHGNRSLNNNVNVSNFYKISYPGYNEIFTGYADPLPIFNKPVFNKTTNVLEYLNKQEAFNGKVVAFSSWNIMPYILNENRSGFKVNSGYELLDGKDELSNLIDSVQKNSRHNKTRNDMLTFLSAKAYAEKNHPKVLFLGFGETDEEAHGGRYDMYLQKATSVDNMIADFWYFIQNDHFYKNNTTLIITTDHGRGKKGTQWQTHGFWIGGSGETWIAMLGPDILPTGEINTPQQIWQKQIASTIALLVGEKFKANHPVAKPINLLATSSATP